jgi:hypothetical protein
MKKKMLLFAMIFIAFGTTFYFTSCNSANAKKLDVARDITPAVTPTREVVTLIDQIRQADPNQQAKILSQNEWLNQRLIMHALQNKYITAKQAENIDTVAYYYGSSDAQAKNKNGKLFDGKIVDELVGFIYIKNVKKPVRIIVYCTNGMFGPELENMKRVGTLPLIFDIEVGNGPNRYVEYSTSIWLADIFGLTLHQGRGWDGPQITPEQAYTLQDSLGKVPVTMRVYPGDRFNLGNMTYTRYDGKVFHAKLE